jgi:hypothetical protein
VNNNQFESLSKEWDIFAKAMGLLDVPHYQYASMKRGFYSGAICMYALIFSGFEHDREPDDNDVARLESLADELEDFRNQVMKGLA